MKSTGARSSSDRVIARRGVAPGFVTPAAPLCIWIILSIHDGAVGVAGLGVVLLCDCPSLDSGIGRWDVVSVADRVN